ncbi:MAG: hypothetical protein IPG34_16400 [Rhodocyclaceae bacterium]|nr:hypothetical protein [Rhodocyclaceae bacterium]
MKAGTGITDLTGIGIWISQQTGIAAAFNKAVTGDERGICSGPLCDKYETRVSMALAGGKHGSWRVESSSVSPTINVEPLIADALSRVLDPLLALRK